VRRPAAIANKKPRKAAVKSFAAPTKGLIANENLAKSTPLGAAVMDNWFPMATTVRMRRGYLRWGTIEDEASPVASLFTYKAGGVEKLFAASTTAIYDATAPEAPYIISLGMPGEYELETDTGDLIGLASLLAPEASGFVSGAWVSCQFTTPGGTFLRLVNGVDTPQVYDGATFATTPAITGPTDPKKLSYVWSFKNRLWFIEGGTLDAWYLPVDTIGGAAVKFPLGAQFSRGGHLVFGASWSLDEGAGLSASCVFVTSEGEVAVYQGSNPADAADWHLKGVYRIGKPLGPKAFMRAGGDLVVATDIGFVPMSEAVRRDYAALSQTAVSFPIETLWNQVIHTRPGTWNVDVWPTQQMALVAPPMSTTGDVFVANVRTGAWGRYTGIPVNCMALFQDRMIVGSSEGRLFQLEATGFDDERTFTATLAPLFSDLGAPAARKIARLARVTTLANSTINDGVSVSVDYVIEKPAAPDAAPANAGAVWGGGVWGQSAWGTGAARQSFAKWRSVGGSGYALTPVLQITSGAISSQDVELVRIDLEYETGDVVT